MTNNSRMRNTGWCVFVSLLLAACGQSQPTEPPPVEETAFRDMAGAVDKARGVEQTLQQQKEELDRTLQRNENPAE